MGEPEGLLLDREHPPAPAPSEDGPGSKAGKKAETCAAQAADRVDWVSRPGGAQGLSAYKPIRRDREDALQRPNGPGGA